MEVSATGKKEANYPGYFGGCREDLPGLGGPWAFPNDCKDYAISREFFELFLKGDGKQVKGEFVKKQQCKKATRV